MTFASLEGRGGGCVRSTGLSGNRRNVITLPVGGVGCPEVVGGGGGSFTMGFPAGGFPGRGGSWKVELKVGGEVVGGSGGGGFESDGGGGVSGGGGGAEEFRVGNGGGGLTPADRGGWVVGGGGRGGSSSELAELSRMGLGGGTRAPPGGLDVTGTGKGIVSSASGCTGDSPLLIRIWSVAALSRMLEEGWTEGGFFSGEVTAFLGVGVGLGFLVT